MALPRTGATHPAGGAPPGGSPPGGGSPGGASPGGSPPSGGSRGGTSPVGLPLKRSGLARWLGVLRLSRRQLQQRWLESALIVLGLALGVGVLTAGETFVRFQQSMVVERLGAVAPEWRAVTVRPRAPVTTEQLFGTNSVPAVRVAAEFLTDPATITAEDVLTLRRDVPGVAHVSVGVGTSRRLPVVTLGDRAGDDLELQLEMVTPDEFAFRGMEFVAGGPFTWDDFAEGRTNIVLEAGSAARLFPDAAPEEWLGQSIATAFFGPGADVGDVWRVVGVVRAHPDDLWARLMTGETSDSVLLGFQPATAGGPRVVPGAAPRPGPAEVTFPQVYVAPQEEGMIPGLIAEIEAYFGQKYGEGRMEARNPQDERAQVTGQLGPFVVALLTLAGLGLVIAAVNVLNLFTARVLRRQRITGMSIALGATRRLLFWQTAGEALLLGAAGSVLGLLLASGLVAGVRGALLAQAGDAGALFADLYAAFRLGAPDAAVGLAAGIGLSLIFGLYPAWLGSRQDPAEALRVE